MAKKRTQAPVTAAAARAAGDLTDLGAPFALMGGLAVSVWGEPRYTFGVDLAVGVAADEDAERLVRELSGRGYEVVTVIEQKRTFTSSWMFATDEDWETAKAMVTLIKARGFHRGRALVTRLRRWRRSTLV